MVLKSRFVLLVPSIFLLIMGWGIGQIPELLIDPFLPISVQVVDQNDELLRIFTTDQGYWRLSARLKQIDADFIKALLRYEDQRFYQHQGVDVLSLVRAAGQFISSGRIISGASTITMQTVRLMQPRPRTLWHKWRQIIQALKLEMRYDKQQILEHYLTLAPYGGNIQGIEAASLFYFGHTAQHLPPSEIALLISLPQSPESRRPDIHTLNAFQARSNVLQRLQKAGLLSVEAAVLAQQQGIPKHRKPTPFLAPHLAQRLQQKSDETIIKTYIDIQLQRRLSRLTQQVQVTLAPATTLAILVVDNRTLEVKVHIGSGDFFTAGQLDLTQAIRSPGSSLKPFIYGLGFEKNQIHPNTKVDDSPYRLGAYRPENFDHQYLGVISLTKALTSSRNIPAVLALQAVGVEPFLQRFRQLGIPLILPNQQPAGLAIALGGVGIHLHNLVSLYAAIANDGQWQALRYQQDQKLLPSKRFLSPLASRYLDDILRKTPAPVGFVRHRPIGYKTGTSYGYRDAWSIGYDDAYTVGVWVGQADGSFGLNQTGFNSAAPVLFQVFDQLPPVQRPVNRSHLRLKPHEELPLHMQWLGKQQYTRLSPNILFPIDGSRLKLNTTQQIVSLAVKGGTPPFYWLINQHVIATLGYQQHASWRPDGKGQHSISVIDARGKMDKIEIWIE